jgi:hypothetical protein
MMGQGVCTSPLPSTRWNRHRRPWPCRPNNGIEWPFWVASRIAGLL